MLAEGYVKMVDLTDRLNGDTRHSNQESREHLEEKDCKLHFLQTVIVLEKMVDLSGTELAVGTL